MFLGGKPLSALGVPIYLLCLCVNTLLFAAEQPKNVSRQRFVAGQEVRIDVNDKRIGGNCFVVYVPSDYNDTRSWPVIFYYHGTGSKPSTKLFRTNTAGKGFIIIGMENVRGVEDKMTREQYIDYLNRELASILAVKAYVSRELKIDEKRLFITGRSMGGWLVSAIAERSAKTWAGIAVFCAERSSIVLPGNKIAMRGKPVYIGTGENDQNRPAALKAAAYYRRLKAKVTFEVYKGLGHKTDDKSVTLHNWLLNSSSTEDKKSNQTDKVDEGR
jgi:poly(3-hydroxybutyrate) depolymerase